MSIYCYNIRKESVIIMENTPHQTINCIDGLELFNTLSKMQHELIFKLVVHRTYHEGERIYSPGEKANAIHIISRGKVRIFRLAENGREQLIRLLLPGEFTGELALFKEGVYEAYAESLETTRICMIHHDDFKELLKSYPTISIKMLNVLADRLSISEQQSTWMSTETSKERLIHYLTRTATLNHKGEYIVKLPMAKKDLASYLGTTPETLSRQWTALKKDGVISQPSRHIVKLKSAHLTETVCKLY